MHSNPFEGEMQRYFDTLPTFVQESIMQSSIEFSNKEEMRSFADQLLRKDI